MAGISPPQDVGEFKRDHAGIFENRGEGESSAVSSDRFPPGGREGGREDGKIKILEGLLATVTFGSDGKKEVETNLSARLELKTFVVLSPPSCISTTPVSRMVLLVKNDKSEETGDEVVNEKQMIQRIINPRSGKKNLD